MKFKLYFVRLFLCFFLVNSQVSLFAQNPTGYIATWKGDVDAAYTIIHDDYGAAVVDGIWQYADTIASNRGIKFVIGAIAQSCEENRTINGYSNAYGYAKNVMLAQHGHEIISHSHDHDCAVGNAGWPSDGGARPCDDFTEYWGESSSYANFNTQLVTAHNSIETGTGFSPVYYIFPYDRFSYIANDKLKDMGYLGSRTGWDGPFPSNPAYHRNGYENSDLSTFYPDADGFFRTAVQVFDGDDDDKSVSQQVAELNGEVDNAISTNMWCNRELHNVGPSGWGAVRVDAYRQHINYLKQKVDEGKLWVGTVSEILTYQMQKLKYSANINYVSASDRIYVTWNAIGSQYNVDIASYLSPLTIKTPITLVVNLDGLTGNYVVKQNSVDLNTDKYYTNDGKMYINVYPHEGDVEIYKSSLNGNHYPYVANPVENQNLNVNFTPFTIDLKNVFEDTETDDEDFVFSANGYEGISVVISNGVATISAPLNWIGTTTVTFQVEDEGELVVTESFDVIVQDPFSNQTPFGGIPASIPGRVEAEDYDEGDEGEAFNEEYSQWESAPKADQYRPWDPVDVDLIAGTAEYGVGHTIAGEWLEYTFNVITDGWYSVDLNVASVDYGGTIPGKIELLVDGNSWMPATDMIFTDSWSDYQNVRYPYALFLEEGTHILKVSFVNGAVNLNYVDILTSPTKTANIASNNAFEIYPNPASNLIRIDAEFTVAKIFSQTGNLIQTSTTKEIDVYNLANGIYFVKLDDSPSMVKFVINK